MRLYRKCKYYCPTFVSIKFTTCLNHCTHIYKNSIARLIFFPLNLFHLSLKCNHNTNYVSKTTNYLVFSNIAESNCNNSLLKQGPYKIWSMRQWKQLAQYGLIQSLVVRNKSLICGVSLGSPLYITSECTEENVRATLPSNHLCTRNVCIEAVNHAPLLQDNLHRLFHYLLQQKPFYR